MRLFQPLVRFWAAFALQVFGIPLKLLAAAIGHIAQQYGFGQRTGVVKVTGCFAAGFAGFNPLLVVADRIGNGRLWALEVYKILFGQEHMPIVIRQEHPLLTDEKSAVSPLGQLAFS